MMNPIKNKCLHSLLSQKGLMDHKRELVMSFSGGRTEHSRDMNDVEANEMIRYLRSQTDPADKMRKKIISMAHEMNWHSDSHWNGTQKVDMQRLNDWCVKYGFGKKKLNDYSYKELPRLVTQFEHVYLSYIKSLK